MASRTGVRSTTSFSAKLADMMGMERHHRQIRLLGYTKSAADFARRQMAFGVGASVSEAALLRYMREYGGGEITGHVWDVAEAEQFPDALIARPLDGTGPGLRVVIFGKDDWKVYASEAPDRPMKLVE